MPKQQIAKIEMQIEGTACNGRLYKEAMNGSKQLIGNPNVTITKLLMNIINYSPLAFSLSWTILKKEPQEFNLNGDLNIAAIMTHANIKLPCGQDSE